MREAPWRRAIRRFAPPILWMAVIMLFSTGLFSSAHTAQAMMPFLHALLPDADPGTLALVHYYVRKAMHLVVFATLGLLWHRALAGTGASRRLAVAVALAVALAFAGVDEFHQAFVPSRTGTLLDVGWDGAGASLALIARRLLWRS